MKKTKPELLAPAGDVDCLKAAILAGADAVYLAGKRFGARAFAANFDEEKLRWARKVTLAQGKKLYITLNTLVFDYEWKLLNEALDFYEDLLPDSLIIQDLGIAAELKRRNSKIPLHLSTQGAWYGQGGTEQLKELGFTRIILPRETTKSEIKDIIDNTPFEIETFVHGAMCYSISGRCFWSSALGTRSGNRGTCAQPCRKEYTLQNSKNSKFLFSPKDLRLINKVNQLAEIGVSSLKIEGRMKSSEYVYQVVSAYRKAIDGTNQNCLELSEVFSRANSEGFFNGTPTPENWKTGDTSGREGVIVAITTGKNKDGLTEAKALLPINKGDGLVWQENGNKKGSKITWVEKSKNSIWLRGLPSNLRANTELVRTSTGKEGDWSKLWNKDLERIPIKLKWQGNLNKPLKVKAISPQKEINSETSELLTSAKNTGLEQGPLKEKFKAISDEFKVIDHDFSSLEKGLYVSLSALKELKNKIAEQLQAKEKPYENTPPITDYSKHFCLNKKQSIRIKIYNQDFPFENSLPADEWLVPWHSDISRASSIVGKNKLAFWLPPILNREQLNKIIKELSNLKSGKFVCFGWEAFELSKALPNLKFEFDWCFNISNLSALDFIRNNKLDAVLAREWRNEEIPENLNGMRCSMSWNPLVSYTRFPKAIPFEKMAKNSHNDEFFALNIGNGVTAMFLKKIIKEFKPLKNASYQIDVAIPETENPAYAFKSLSRIL